MTDKYYEDADLKKDDDSLSDYTDKDSENMYRNTTSATEECFKNLASLPSSSDQLAIFEAMQKDIDNGNSEEAAEKLKILLTKPVCQNEEAKFCVYNMLAILYSYNTTRMEHLDELVDACEKAISLPSYDKFNNKFEMNAYTMLANIYSDAGHSDEMYKKTLHYATEGLKHDKSANECNYYAFYACHQLAWSQDIFSSSERQKYLDRAITYYHNTDFSKATNEQQWNISRMSFANTLIMPENAKLKTDYEDAHTGYEIAMYLDEKYGKAFPGAKMLVGAALIGGRGVKRDKEKGVQLIEQARKNGAAASACDRALELGGSKNKISVVDVILFPFKAVILVAFSAVMIALSAALIALIPVTAIFLLIGSFGANTSTSPTFTDCLKKGAKVNGRGIGILLELIVIFAKKLF